jgi:hypothetical protein
MALYRVRAHIHHYTEYMELDDIAAAAGSLTDMISAYNESECRTLCLCAPHVCAHGAVRDECGRYPKSPWGAHQHNCMHECRVVFAVEADEQDYGD